MYLPLEIGNIIYLTSIMDDKWFIQIAQKEFVPIRCHLILTGVIVNEHIDVEERTLLSYGWERGCCYD